MEAYTVARVVLLSDGDIHIAYQNRQTFYCTPRALLLLLSEPLQFIEQGRSFLDTSTYLLNKNLDLVDKIQGLTLLSVYSDKRIVCEFSELFKLMYSPYILSSSEADQKMHLSFEMLQSLPRDDKQDLIRLFMAYTQSVFANGQKKKRHLDIDAETKSKIVSEIINTSINGTVKQEENGGDIAPVMEVLNKKANLRERIIDIDAEFEQVEIIDMIEKATNDYEVTETDIAVSPSDDSYISIEEFAKIHGVKVQTVKEWIKKGKIKSVHYDKCKQYWIDANEKVVDLRANRKLEERNDGTGRKYVRLQGNSYTDLQKYIKERGLVTSAVRIFIRSLDEIKYYEKRHYHEVKWETGSALIIDINPDYYSKTEGKTNREIIASGGAPVVPQNEGYRFHLHHIGQKPESPFAIIPEHDHNGTEYYSIFHQGKASKENLHDKSYEEQKKLFWETYIKYYDQYGSFQKIPYLNSKHKRKQVQ